MVHCRAAPPAISAVDDAALCDGLAREHALADGPATGGPEEVFRESTSAAPPAISAIHKNKSRSLCSQARVARARRPRRSVPHGIARVCCAVGTPVRYACAASRGKPVQVPHGSGSLRLACLHVDMLWAPWCPPSLGPHCPETRRGTSAAPLGSTALAGHASAGDASDRCWVC